MALQDAIQDAIEHDDSREELRCLFLNPELADARELLAQYRLDLLRLRAEIMYPYVSAERQYI
ncbi:MAG: hypothetical protein V1725_06605 [archaeon]